jgi:hypothetical protein
MRARFKVWIVFGVTVATGVACQRKDREAQQAPPLASPAGAAIAEPTLRQIMQVLGDEMAAVAAGLWLANDSAIVVAARHIADHPQVTPIQRNAIQAALGAAFPRFGQYDHAVHEAATELADRALRGEPIPALLAGYHKIQQGCVACHEEFRVRVIAATTRAGSQR